MFKRNLTSFHHYILVPCKKYDKKFVYLAAHWATYLWLILTWFRWVSSRKMLLQCISHSYIASKQFSIFSVSARRTLLRCDSHSYIASKQLCIFSVSARNTLAMDLSLSCTNPSIYWFTKPSRQSLSERKIMRLVTDNQKVFVSINDTQSFIQ